MCQKVIPIPDVTVLRRMHSADEYVLLACDGLWDVMKTPEVIAVASKGFSHFPPPNPHHAPPVAFPAPTAVGASPKPLSAATSATAISPTPASAPTPPLSPAQCPDGPAPDGNRVRAVCDTLVQLALKKESRDNVSVLLVLPSRLPRTMSAHSSSASMISNIASSVARHAGTYVLPCF